MSGLLSELLVTVRPDAVKRLEVRVDQENAAECWSVQMTVGVELGRPIDRILGWLEYIPRLLRRRKRKQRILELFEQSLPLKWLTLGLAARHIGLDDQRDRDLSETAKLLAVLPQPGPARPDRSDANRNKQRREQLWGLEGTVGK